MSFRDLVADMDRTIQDVLGGVSVVYAPSVGAAVTVIGMFDDNYTTADGEQSAFGTSIPAVVLRLEDLPEDPRDERPGISISGIAYTMVNYETDGVEGGSIRLILRESA